MTEERLSFLWIIWLLLSVVTIILLDEVLASSGNKTLVLSFLGLLCVIVVYYLYGKANREKTIQQQFSKKILDAREAERKKIASELHDGLQQELHSIDIEINRITNKTFTPKEQLTNISKRIINTIDEVRRISSELYPHQLDNLGLKKSLIALANSLSDISEVYFSVKIEENIDPLFDQEASIHIYRIVQELFNNVIKHSNASKANMTITTNNIQLFIAIGDNGKGFVSNLKIVDNSRKGLGIHSIQERLKLMNGTMEIKSQIGKGSAFKITIPVKNIYKTI